RRGAVVSAVADGASRLFRHRGSGQRRLCPSCGRSPPLVPDEACEVGLPPLAPSERFNAFASGLRKTSHATAALISNHSFPIWLRSKESSGETTLNALLTTVRNVTNRLAYPNADWFDVGPVCFHISLEKFLKSKVL